MRHLITGSKSGLGKFLQEKLNAVGFSRQDTLASVQEQGPYDTIIHCAYNTGRGVTSASLRQYVSDNLLLTQKLLEIPHKKFIFVSTSDVYPRDVVSWKEDEAFPVEKIEGLYGLSKLMTEMMVQEKAANCLILRPTALLGKYSRMNSLIRILYGQDVQLTLAPESRFNYILHEDVLDFIQTAITRDTRGVFNLASVKNVSLGEVAAAFKREVKFGTYLYNVANLCNAKAVELCRVFANSSLANIKRFQSVMGDESC